MKVLALAVLVCFAFCADPVRIVKTSTTRANLLKVHECNLTSDLKKPTYLERQQPSCMPRAWPIIPSRIIKHVQEKKSTTNSLRIASYLSKNCT